MNHAAPVGGGMMVILTAVNLIGHEFWCNRTARIEHAIQDASSTVYLRRGLPRNEPKDSRVSPPQYRSQLGSSPMLKCRLLSSSFPV